jgi:hypothetical protein
VATLVALREAGEPLPAAGSVSPSGSISKASVIR